jgi:hypothetical protein
MATTKNADEAGVLQDLLADSHARIRELESRVDWLANHLLTLMLNDRRRLDGSHSNIECERRRTVVHAVTPQRHHTKSSSPA